MALLTYLSIENYQALAAARFELGRFTVVTGPTGSGKSAVIRALRLAVFNARGTSFIRHGQPRSLVAVQDDAGLAVALVRGKGQDAYIIDIFGEQKKFTKLGGQVPAEVTELLNFSELNFAAQFDRPYLLDASAGEVARMLGRLTNVDLLFEAARLGYARKQGISRDLKRAQADVTQLNEAIQQYEDLPFRLAHLDDAEGHVRRAAELRTRLNKLNAMVQAALTWHQAFHLAAEAAEAAAPPSLATLDSLAARRARLRELVLALSEADREIAAKADYAGLMSGAAQAAHAGIHVVLTDAGVCPTCELPVPRQGKEAV